VTQTKSRSMFEACINTCIGYVIALISQLVIFPIMGIHVPLSTNIIISLWFLGVSLIRGYIIRRYFNNKE